MFDLDLSIYILVMLVVLVFLGIEIAISLALTSIFGLLMVTNSFEITMRTVSGTMFEGLRGYIFAVLPLFMLMGEFIGRSGAAHDIFVALNRTFTRVPGRLALATVFGNAIFAFLTGVSIAAAATFSRIAYPVMRRYGYDKSYALGAISGSACLGMLIPPSTLMILWGILIEESIGKIFIAGILPGLLLASLFGIYVTVAAVINPRLVGEESRQDAAAARSVGAASVSDQPDLPADVEGIVADAASVRWSIAGMAFLIFAVLGGIWFGVFTPIEAAGVGALLSLIFGLLKGMRARDVVQAVLRVGRTAAPILLMLLAALLFSRTVALTGVGGAIEDFFVEAGLSKWAILGVMVAVWFLFGMVIDSKSIMLLTVPIFAPLADLLGYQSTAFAIIGILAIEAGLLTPPFGLVVYTVKGSIGDDSVTTMTIFRGSTPYWIMLLIVTTLVAVWPEIATYLVDHTF